MSDSVNVLRNGRTKDMICYESCDDYIFSEECKKLIQKGVCPHHKNIEELQDIVRKKYPKVDVLRSKAKTPKEIWIINSEVNIENSKWVPFDVVDVEVKKLSDFIEKLHESMKQLEEEHTDMRLEKQKLEEEIKKVKDENESLTRNNIVFRASNRGYNIQWKKYTKQIDAVQKILDEIEKHLNEMHDSCSLEDVETSQSLVEVEDLIGKLRVVVNQKPKENKQ